MLDSELAASLTAASSPKMLLDEALMLKPPSWSIETAATSGSPANRLAEVRATSSSSAPPSTFGP